MRQHGDTEAGERGVELRDQVGAAQACGDLRRHLRQIVELGREQELLDIADETMTGQVAVSIRFINSSCRQSLIRWCIGFDTDKTGESGEMLTSRFGLLLIVD